jgi:glycosyltransferase involved in cell wall biosynthesis
MICPFWLPKHGGGEQYDYRLALELIKQGFEVHVFTGTSAQEGKDNGALQATRHVNQGDVLLSSWRSVFLNPKGDSFKLIMDHYALMNEAVQWCIKYNIQIALISNFWQQIEFSHVRELYLQLKVLKIKTGVLHFDIAPQIQKSLNQDYQHTKSWHKSKEKLSRSLRKISNEHSHLYAMYMIGSPLFFEPDFVISCSEWNTAFIDPLNTTDKIVLHPILDREYWSKTPQNHNFLDYRDILMINPSKRKCPKLMADLIKSEQVYSNFRILKGGWGDSFKLFIPMISGTPAFNQNRIDLLEYVYDIRQAYHAAGLIFFPSFYEGYGMTAVEPMFAGTPVVSSNYPAIMEAVGSGALTLCPYHDTPDKWVSAVNELLNNRDFWSQRALSRTIELDARQKMEIVNLCDFLTKQVNHV